MCGYDLIDIKPLLRSIKRILVSGLNIYVNNIKQ